MGVCALCSLPSEIPTNLRFTSECEDGDDEEPKPVLKKSKTMPAKLQELETKTTYKFSAKTVSRERGFSLRGQINEWHRTGSLRSIEKGERVAKKYINAVQNDSLKNLRDTVHIAGSIARKGADINEELARQSMVISKSKRDLSNAERDIDESARMLRGMRSYRGKFANYMSTSSVEDTFENENQSSNFKPTFDLTFENIDIGFCSSSKKVRSARPFLKSVENSTQRQIMGNVQDLHSILDNINHQQRNTADELERQEIQLKDFENQVNGTKEKIRENCLVATYIKNGQ